MGKTISNEQRLELMSEVAYIQERAAEHDSRVVTISDLLLFSAKNGDGWLLDTSDRLAMRLADGGKPVAVTIDEKGVEGAGASFAIRWPGRYRIDGFVFIFVDETAGGLDSFNGYPTQQIAKHGRTDTSPLLAADRDTLDLLRRMRRQTGKD
jgi:hypothetical protein